MPRPLVFGNGALLIQADRDGSLRDLFWPIVGQYNHLQGHRIELGVWVDGALSWLRDYGWQRSQAYQPGSLVGESTFIHEDLGIRLHISEAVHPDPETPVFVRKYRLESLRAGQREVRVFQHHDLRLQESDIGDTAFYHAESASLIHYKREFYFLFGGTSELGGLYETTTRIRGPHGACYSRDDAYDGHLEYQPINQGSVDSCLSLRHLLRPDAPCEGQLWIAAGKDLGAVLSLHSGLDVGEVLQKAEGQAVLWSIPGPLGPMPSPRPDAVGALPTSGPTWTNRVEKLVRQTLPIIASQCDQNGAILAANDSDIMETNRATYSFVWARDGALVSMATDLAGHPEFARKFFEFSLKLVTPENPIFLHKYGPDGTLGASWHPWLYRGVPETPWQQDSTALTVLAMATHDELYPNPERSKQLFDCFAAPACDLMALHREANGLPMPSWDLWEERRGVHAYTAATTIAAFQAASGWATRLGDARAVEYAVVADSMMNATWERLYCRDRQRFVRMIGEHGPDYTLDSAILALGLFNVVEPNDPRWISCVDQLESGLRCHGGIDGMARYEHDYYFRKTDRFPGNPWVICTLWLAQEYVRRGDEASMGVANGWLEWVADRAESTGVLAEQYHPETGEPHSVSPLTWSHAELLRTAILLKRAQK